MSRGLGRIQSTILSALRHHGREARLDSLAALAAGLIPDLGARFYGRAPSRAIYVATARAVAALLRRGLVDTETVGTTRGKLEWHRGDDGRVRPQWSFRNPSKYVVVRVRVDSSGPPSVTSVAPVGDHRVRGAP